MIPVATPHYILHKNDTVQLSNQADEVLQCYLSNFRPAERGNFFRKNIFLHK